MLIGLAVALSVGQSYQTLCFFYGYFMDVNAHGQITTAYAQLITAPAQPPAKGVAVYTALLSFEAACNKRMKWGEMGGM